MAKRTKQPKVKRDYRAEYKRRVARAAAKGLSKAQARGHRKASEAPVTKSRKKKALEDHRLQVGLRYLRKEKNFSKAAKEAGISPERLRTYALEQGIIEKRGRRWTVKRDLPRCVLIFSDGREKQITVGDFSEASLVGKYMSAVGAFVRSNNNRYLRPFIGKSVTDISGKSHLLETRPNILYRIVRPGGTSFEQIYRIVI